MCRVSCYLYVRIYYVVCSGLDVRVARAGLEAVAEDDGVGERGEGALRLEQAAPLQLPGLAAAPAAARRARHHAPRE